ncbi:MAG: HlyD family secretion protein [Gammaproteobacteria bacterium]
MRRRPMDTVLAVVGAGMLAACSGSSGEVYTGYAEADLVYVSAPSTGVLQSLAVTRGARVEAGAELFRLDADVESMSRAEAAAQLAQAQAQAANLRKGKRPAEIAAIEQQLVQASASLDASRAQLARNTELVRRGFVSASRLDDLRAAEERDAARVRELEAQLTIARAPARADEIAAAEAQARAASAWLAQGAWREEQKRQLAPTTGLVYDVTYRIGERVPANTPVVALLPNDGLKLRFYVPQAKLAALRVGQSVAVRCDGCAAGLTARVSFVSPQAEYTPPVIYSNENRSKLVFLVEARPEGEARSWLKPGQPIDVRLVTAPISGARP